MICTPFTTIFVLQFLLKCFKATKYAEINTVGPLHKDHVGGQGQWSL